jgi:hypothetical protein
MAIMTLHALIHAWTVRTNHCMDCPKYCIKNNRQKTCVYPSSRI